MEKGEGEGKGRGGKGNGREKEGEGPPCLAWQGVPEHSTGSWQLSSFVIHLPWLRRVSFVLFSLWGRFVLSFGSTLGDIWGGMDVCGESSCGNCPCHLRICSQIFKLQLCRSTFGAFEASLEQNQLLRSWVCWAGPCLSGAQALESWDFLLLLNFPYSFNIVFTNFLIHLI